VNFSLNVELVTLDRAP